MEEQNTMVGETAAEATPTKESAVKTGAQPLMAAPTAPATEELEPIENLLKPASTSRISTILNGMGNGAMIGGAPLAITAGINGWRGKPVSPKLNQFNIALTVSGVVLGALYGVAEAKHVSEYRKSITDNINDLRRRLHEHEKQHAVAAR